MLEISVDDTPRKIAASLTPLPDESLPGFLCRLADWNMIGPPHQLYRAIGVWPTGLLSDHDLARLAKRTGTDLSELGAHRQRTGLLRSERVGASSHAGHVFGSSERATELFDKAQSPVRGIEP
jgi:hypothetical protein